MAFERQILDIMIINEYNGYKYYLRNNLPNNKLLL